MLYPNDENGDVLRRLEADGDDLSRPRDIDFTVVFPDGIKAAQFAQQLQCEGYRTTARFVNVVRTHPWEVVVVRNMIPTHSGITDFEDELQNLADTLDGRNDGWGCFSQPPKHVQ
jgi:hypothetical protein